MVIIDPNWILAIIALVSVVSPTISVYLNNKQQLKLKKLELFEKSKYQAIEKFIRDTQAYLFETLHTVDSKADFEASISNLFLYFSIPNYSLFEKLKEAIDSKNEGKVQFAISEIVKYLSLQIKR